MSLDRTPDEIMQAKRGPWWALARPFVLAAGFVVLAMFLLGLATEPLRGVSR